MTEWFGAILSMSGIVGFGIYAATTYVGDRFGWLDKDGPIGYVGCSWLAACATVILMGGIVEIARLVGAR